MRILNLLSAAVSFGTLDLGSDAAQQRRLEPYMKLSSLRSLTVLTVALSTMGLSAAAAANFPSKQVAMIVAAGPGSGPDVLARILADRLSQAWGQQITVMNKVGGYG